MFGALGRGAQSCPFLKKFTFLAPPGGIVRKPCATRSTNFDRTSHLRLRYQNLEL